MSSDFLDIKSNGSIFIENAVDSNYIVPIYTITLDSDKTYLPISQHVEDCQLCSMITYHGRIVTIGTTPSNVIELEFENLITSVSTIIESCFFIGDSQGFIHLSTIDGRVLLSYNIVKSNTYIVCCKF